MRSFRILLLFLFVFAGIVTARATVFGTVRGIVHDQQHHPIEGASVVLHSRTSDFQITTVTNDNGEFEFQAVPLGEYTLTVSHDAFDTLSQSITLLSGSAPILHFPLQIAAHHESVTVSAEAPSAQTESVTPTTTVDLVQIARTPGADQTNSLAMITNFVPGAYLTHDQLHVRGGHQVTWLVDGVPIPNTNIASNLGPQIDPKDIDVLEMQRGSYSADFGDRTYGVFDATPRTGFDRSNQAELIASFGNLNHTDDQLSFGSHTDRFAYYASLNGNRTDLGLQTPTSAVLRDAANGFGGFGTLIFNADPQDQLRLVASLRRDFYQIPNTPQLQSLGIHDGEHETDSFVDFSWVRTFSPRWLLTVSPFFHHNRAAFESNPTDFPIATTDDRSSDYAGGQATLALVTHKHNARAGIYAFGQRDQEFFGLIFNNGSNPNFHDTENIKGSVIAAFVEDQYRLTSWLTLNAGLRQTHFSGGVTENSSDPRVGVALRIPVINWVFRGFYGHFYQAPPLITASGPLLNFVNSQNLGFLPLHGERDEEFQYGVTIPWKGWALDADTFRTRADNFFDHNSLGNSDIFFPITIDGALIRGWEFTLHSPRIARRGNLYLTYSNQIAKGRGAINGGLTNFSPPAGFFLLDHDQRNTLNLGGTFNLPWRAWASSNVYYGSGFSNGNLPLSHLPGHTTFDLSLGKDFGENFSISLSALNVANRRVLLDNSLTFGGTHFIHPREMSIQLRYRFHY
ncbi:MAG: TonB-dependent receptor [Candidatus Acidiferrales bacterium]